MELNERARSPIIQDRKPMSLRFIIFWHGNMKAIVELRFERQFLSSLSFFSESYGILWLSTKDIWQALKGERKKLLKDLSSAEAIYNGWDIM
jgi:hypothetical protein